MSQWWQILTRRKQLDANTVSNTQLARVLNTFDLTALGIGSTLGVGVYVLAGHVAKDIAGPSVIISFLIAAIASVFAGLCYAEFGARFPKAGSAYIYSYVTVGELIAFIIGWNLILEYIIGSASVARGLTLYLDSMLNNTLSIKFKEIAPITQDGFLAEYFDFLSFSITLLLGVGLAFGLKESKWVNNIFTITNVCVVLFVVIAGSLYAKPENWQIQGNVTNKAIGKGGFMPFGFGGTIKGAATCFYGFIGFDCISTTGEEVKNPKRAIPISIILSLFIIFLAYFGTATVLTLMVPYYEQDPNAPIPHVFEVYDFEIGKWVVTIGGIFGLMASLFGALFPLPRIIYAMASDSLIFRFLGNINQRFQTPVAGTIIASILTGLMAAMFELSQLVNMMSIGTLLAYTIVAACVLLLRYTLEDEDRAPIQHSLLQHESDSEYEYTENTDSVENDGEYSNLLSSTTGNMKIIFGQIFNCRKRIPNHLTRKLISVQVALFCFFALAFGICMKYLIEDLSNMVAWAIVITSIITILMLLTLLSIWNQPTSKKDLPFKVPFVPLIPALSILVNIYLMLMLDVNTWIRFGVWMAVGLPIYFASACMYNKPISNKKQYKIRNGTINYAYQKEETVEQLTIPEIVIDAPVPEENELPKPETENNTLRNRKISGFGEHAVVIEPDKVSDNEKQNEEINNNKCSCCPEHVESDTESESSEEHHITVDVHRENGDEDKTEELVQKRFTSDRLYTQKELEDFEKLTQIPLEQINMYVDIFSVENDRIKSCKLSDETKKVLRTIDIENIRHFLELENLSDEQAVEALNKIISEEEQKQREKEMISDKEAVKIGPRVFFTFPVDDAEEDEESRMKIDDDLAPKNEVMKILEEPSLRKDSNTETNESIEITNLSSSPKNNPMDEINDQNDEIVSEKDEQSIEYADNERSDDISGDIQGETDNIPKPPPLPPDFHLFTPEPTPVNSPVSEKFGTTPAHIRKPIGFQLITPEHLQIAKLKKMQTLPTKKISTVSVDFNDNVKFGTKQYEKIKLQLTDLFQNYSPPQTSVYRHSSLEPEKSATEETQESLVPPKTPPDVPSGYARSQDFKNKLGEILKENQKKNSITIFKYNVNVGEASNNEQNENSIVIPKTVQKVLDKDKEDHKKRMIATLKSIKLRKIGEINFEENNKTDDNAGTEQQDVNEAEINKNNDTENDIKDETKQTTHLPRSIENKLNQNQEEHKKKMVATLRSIKLRKTGFLTEGGDSERTENKDNSNINR